MTDTVDFYAANAGLAGIESLDIDALRLLYRLECSGEDFYNAVADRIEHDEAADLLRRNGREEIGHAERVRRAIGLKLGTDYQPAGDDLVRFAVPLPDRISPRLLPAVVQGELDGNASYERWAGNETDPAVARLLRQNGREEIQHGRRVEQAIALLESKE